MYTLHMLLLVVLLSAYTSSVLRHTWRCSGGSKMSSADTVFDHTLHCSCSSKKCSSLTSKFKCGGVPSSERKQLGQLAAVSTAKTVLIVAAVRIIAEVSIET
jgi:hypothetical protein